MLVKETIAVVGLGNKIPDFLKEVLEKDFYVLFVAEAEENRQILQTQLNNQTVSAEYELMDCAKNGCWEADTIFLFNLEKLNEALIAEMRKVSVQKLMIFVVNDFAGLEKSPLALFPLSKQLLLNAETLEIKLKLEDMELLPHLKKIFGETLQITNF